MREPRNTQNTRKNGEVKSEGVDFNAEAQRRRGWEVRRFGWIMSIKPSISAPQEELLSVFLHKGVIRFIEESEKRTNVTSSDLSKYQLVEPGDFVMNNQQAWRGSVGVSQYRGIVSPAYFVMRLANCLKPDFANYLLRSRSVVSIFEQCSRGVGTIQRNLIWDMLKVCCIAFPPLSEQKAIVKYLDAETGRIDKAIAAEEKMIALLQERREIVINEAVSGSGKCGSEGVDFNAEAQRRRGWEVRKVKQCAIIEHGSNPKIDGDVPVYGSGAESFKTCGEFKEGPSVLLGRKGTVNIPRYVEGRFWNVDTAFNVCTRKNMLLRFFYYCATCFDYDRYVSQTAIPSMTQRDYENMPIPLPPLAEQEEIVKYLDAGTGKIDRAIEVKRRQIELLRERRQIVIDEAVTGKVKVA